MAPRKEADKGFGAALDRIAARLAHPLAAFDIPVDLRRAQHLEGDDGIGDANPRPTVRIDDADPRPDMMPPSRKQAEHAPQIGFVDGLFEDAAAHRDRRVTRKHDLVRRALDRERLALGEARDIGARKLALQRRFVDVGGRDAGGRDADPRQQFTPARRGRGEHQMSHGGGHFRRAAHLKR